MNTRFYTILVAIVATTCFVFADSSAYKYILLYTQDCDQADTICVSLPNDPILIGATANEGSQFVQWSDGNTDNPRSISITTNDTATYTAIFESSTPTRLDNAKESKGKVLSPKYYQDGQLYILRDGKTYNTQGTKVK